MALEYPGDVDFSLPTNDQESQLRNHELQTQTAMGLDVTVIQKLSLSFLSDEFHQMFCNSSYLAGVVARSLRGKSRPSTMLIKLTWCISTPS